MSPLVDSSGSSVDASRVESAEVAICATIVDGSTSGTESSEARRGERSDLRSLMHSLFVESLFYQQS